MQQKSDDFSMQEALKLAGTPAGKQLLALIQQADRQAVNQAMAQAAGGDLSGAMQLLAPLLASDEAKSLMEQLGGPGHG